MRFSRFLRLRAYLARLKFKAFPQKLPVIATVMAATVVVVGEPANVTATARATDNCVVLPNNPFTILSYKVVRGFSYGLSYIIGGLILAEFSITTKILG